MTANRSSPPTANQGTTQSHTHIRTLGHSVAHLYWADPGTMFCSELAWMNMTGPMEIENQSDVGPDGCGIWSSLRYGMLHSPPPSMPVKGESG